MGTIQRGAAVKFWNVRVATPQSRQIMILFSESLSSCRLYGVRLFHTQKETVQCAFDVQSQFVKCSAILKLQQ